MYPDEILLSPERERALINYLHEELINHYMERDDWVNQLIRYQREYWAEPRIKFNTFPFKGAANIVIPLTAIAVETIHSRTMTTLFGLEDQFVSVKPKNKDWADAATPFERFINHEMLNVMDIYKPFDNICLEITKYGTGVSKSSYERVIKTAVRKVNGEEQRFKVVQKDGAQVYSVPLGKFLMRFDSKNTETSDWCGEEHNDTIYQIEQKEKSGMFRKGTVDALKAWVTRSVAGTEGQERKTERVQERLEDRTPVWPKWIDWCELYMSFDVDDTGEQREIVVCYHRSAQYFMSIRNNWNHDLRRPYDTEVYFPVEHRWTGIGICKQNEQFQREVTAQHRQRLDNATIANMRMIKINKSSGYGPGEPVMPGKIWLVDSKDDIESFQMGEIYNSAYQNEQATLIYSQQRTGVNEVTLGMPQVGTPGTATGDLARIQEGNKKFDFAYKNIKRLTNKVITKTALNIQQFGPKDLSYFDQSDDGNLVQKFLTLPPSWIADGLILQLGSAGQQQNKIIDKQNWVAMAPMLQQYYQGLLQLEQVVQQGGSASQIALKGMQAATEAMRQILESYDVRNLDKIILMQMLSNPSQFAPQQNGQQPGIGGPQIPPGINSQPTLPGSPQIPSLLGAGIPGQASQIPIT